MEKLHYDPKAECCEDPAAGDFFPDLQALTVNALNRGRIFSVRPKSLGVITGIPDLEVDRAAWRQCLLHPYFEANYLLSMAKISFQQSLNIP
jgi:hypothetical protein